jgi:hypothetical protein
MTIHFFSITQKLSSMKRLLLFVFLFFAMIAIAPYEASAQDSRGSKGFKTRPGEGWDGESKPEKKLKNTYGKEYSRKRAPHGHKWVWTKRKEYISAGISLNAMNYFGDITPRPNFLSTDIRMTRPNVSVFVAKRFFPNITGRFMLSYGRIMGADSLSANPADGHDVFRYIRNASFRSDIFEATAVMQYDLIAETEINKVYYKRPKKIIPYVNIGIGVFYHNPKAKVPEEYGGDWIALQQLGTEGQGRSNPLTGQTYGDLYSKLQICLPVGIGFRKRLSDRFDIAFEMMWRFTLTDYLDDVSKSYLNKGVFAKDEDGGLAWAMHDRSLEAGRETKLRQMYADGTAAYVPSIRFTPNVGDPNYKGYRSFDGFGNDFFPDNIRGNVRDRDVYITTGLHLIYIIPPSQVRCPIIFK